MDKIELQIFLENNIPAFKHLFSALDAYNELKKQIKKNMDNISENQSYFHNDFLSKQFSSNANFYYSQSMKIYENLEEKKKKEGEINYLKLEKEFKNYKTTIESISCIAGSILQIAKQILSLYFGEKPKLDKGRRIGKQSIIELIWEGRNHSMHWEEKKPRESSKKMLEILKDDGFDIVLERNNSFFILKALNWKEPNDLINDIKLIVE